jgi:hypothetical protein
VARTWGLILALCATPLGLFLSTSPSASAEVSFTVTASARGVYSTSTAPGVVPLGLGIDAGGTTAQASVNSLQNSTGFAASPDPGSTSRTGLGTVTGSFPPGTVPDYPLLVSSNYPTRPEASADAGATVLKASSTATASQARAVAGGAASVLAAPAVTGESQAAAIIDGQQAHADAMATVEGVTAAGVLELSRVHSEAHASVDASGHLTLSSKIDIGAATVAGVPVTIGADGLHAAGSAVPVPTSDLVKALAAQGISVSVSPEQRTKTGIIAAGIRIVIAGDAPLAGAAMTSYQLGFASADVSGGVGGGSVASSPSPSSPGRARPSAGGATKAAATLPNGSRPAVGPGPGPSTGPGLGPPPAPLAPTVTDGGVAPDPAVANPATAPQTAQLARHGQLAARLDLLDLYLVIAGAGLVAYGAGQLIRYMGVRSAWMQ